ncbi:response regulator [Sphingomonas sp. RHCKR47]|uniref:hybrid sensor histidine kinase/response regulator n=1 Tax=Sphingomonas citricola TaxID=2862498 RepID=UPI001CA5112D|nr:response regulator [Sphingomonas citricola]MBW6523746.1 response regulator [Sphingomonas citricola]
MRAGGSGIAGGPRAALLIALAAGAVAGGLVLWLIGSIVVAAGFLAAAVVIMGVAIGLRVAFAKSPVVEPVTDWSLAAALAGSNADAVAVTGRSGHLVCANAAYETLCDGFPTPPALSVSDADLVRLTAAGRDAWRDGQATLARIEVAGAPLSVEVTRSGHAGDHLVWRFAGQRAVDTLGDLARELAGTLGDRLGEAGVMAALMDPAGRVVAGNRVLCARALGRADAAIAGHDLAELLVGDAHGTVHFTRDEEAAPLRLLQVALGSGEGTPMLVALIDDLGSAPAVGNPQDVQTLLSVIPFGLALVDREGRFIAMNAAFARMAAAEPAAPPLYPGDLVVREDKAAVADAVRRFTTGGAQSADLAIRLKGHPDEPVALSIAATRGFGGASVLLSFKENGEENRLKREVAQATKMQAVGQLAGGVAHDFNNILTAIIGHCDLMLMRHSPGDSDYDDIQQIRANSNRAASLTRQLLAFSRQQTLRPQVLQLPDVVSEVSTLLRRLLGETVVLEVKHGRDLGAVRADPGQLEQVVVNLAVNARDAMLTKGPGATGGGGRVTIQTRAATIAEVRARGTDIMPLGDYTALEITDTGTGIPPEVLPKIFEPFFTTKEVGKGTGLGLSTVYGIVKQSGGYIFADSRPGQGATFTIYFPVHAAGEESAAPRATVRTKPTDTWGSGTILLVEDEDMVRAIAERALTRQGYTVLAADHGEAALELLETAERPSLIVSDVMMPVMDGPTLARAVRQRYPDIPILFMSGYAEEQLRRSIDLDHVAFLPKPFSVQQLAEAARDALANG